MIICKRTGLDPFARQIYMVKRGDKMVTESSIDGLRLVAERSGKYAGQLGPFWCGKDKVWHDLWIEKEHPIAAKVGILRKDFTEPLWATAIWDQYVPLSPFMWNKLPSLMIAKCAEALGLRKAFPQELSGIYAKEEMEQAGVVETKQSFTPHQTTEVKDVTSETKPNPKQEKEDINAPACTEDQVKTISALVALTSKPMVWDKWICDNYSVQSYGELTAVKADKIIKYLEEGLAKEKDVGKSDNKGAETAPKEGTSEKPKASPNKIISEKQIAMIEKLIKHWRTEAPGKLSLTILSVGGKSLQTMNSFQASKVIEILLAESKSDHAEAKAKDETK